MSYYIAVHGGAGYHSSESEREVRKAMRRACAKALLLLKEGGKATDAVEAAIMDLEDSECLNAGFGSNLTHKGTVECDAAIMEDSGNFGSTGAVSGVKNPICVAKAILNYSCRQDSLGRVPPLTLVSSGAYEFARENNIPTVAPDSMISTRSRNEWRTWSEKAQGNTSSRTVYDKLGGENTLIQDTVGCVALDMYGSLSAGVSSGGLLLKLPGRVGEAAVYGAGCWAHCLNANKGVATSVSGTGEAIIRAALARALSETLDLEDPLEGLRSLLVDKFPDMYAMPDGQTPSAGAVLLAKETREDGSSVPRLWCVFNTSSMAVAYASSDNPQAKGMILKQSKLNQEIEVGKKSVYLTVLPWNT